MASESRGPAWLAPLGELLGITALALPGIGVLRRFVSLEFLDVPADWILIGRLPVRDLAVLGGESIVIGILLFAAVWVVLVLTPRFKIRFQSEPETGAVRGKGVRTQVARWAFIALEIGAILWLVLFFGSWPSVLIGVALSFAAGYIALRIVTERDASRLANWWPVAVLLWLIGVFSSSFVPVGVSVGHYTFTPGSPMDDGFYLRLGEADSRAWLMSCDEPEIGEVVIEVPTDLVRQVSYGRTSFENPTLFEVLFRDADLINAQIVCRDGRQALS